MKELMKFLDNLGFDSAIDYASEGIENLECLISNLKEFYNKKNIDENVKTNVTHLIEYIDSLDDNLNHIKGTYELITDIAKEEDDDEDF